MKSVKQPSVDRVVGLATTLGLAAELDRILRRYGVLLVDLMGRSKRPRFTRARQEVWLLLYDSGAHISLPEIGEMFGRHHTTVMTGLRYARARGGDECSMKWIEERKVRAAG